MDSGSRASAARRAIVEAYIDLMEEKPYDSIRVKELVQRIALDDNKLEERMSELEKREKKS